jgi:voltage-dependent calcium channel
MEKKRSGRMTAVPQLDVPEIFVDDENDRARAAQQRSTLAVPPTPAAPSDFLTVSDTTRPQHRSWSLGADLSTYDTTQSHPLSAPRVAPTVSGNHPESSTYNFDVQENPVPNTERHGGEVTPTQVRSFLDDSVWAESIRRSATVRKSVRRSDWTARH